MKPFCSSLSLKGGAVFHILKGYIFMLFNTEFLKLKINFIIVFIIQTKIRLTLNQKHFNNNNNKFYNFEKEKNINKN